MTQSFFAISVIEFGCRMSAVRLHHKPEHSAACVRFVRPLALLSGACSILRVCIMEWVGARAAFVPSISACNRRTPGRQKLPRAQTKRVTQFQMNGQVVPLKGFDGVRQSAPWICLRHT
jgi:hypothetical protein